MINEERIILMTKLAIYEKNEGKEESNIVDYFRGDYITLQVMKAFFYGTICFAIGLALYIFYDLDVTMEKIFSEDILEFVFDILIAYVSVIAIYCTIFYIVTLQKYYKAR